MEPPTYAQPSGHSGVHPRMGIAPRLGNAVFGAGCPKLGHKHPMGDLQPSPVPAVGMLVGLCCAGCPQKAWGQSQGVQ